MNQSLCRVNSGVVIQILAKFVENAAIQRRRFIFPIIHRRFPYPPRFRRMNSLVLSMESSTTSEKSPVKLNAIEATPESFAEFGQFIGASPDDVKFGPEDAQLDLSRGIPRFYIMHIENRPLRFSTITHHANVTQCLGSASGQIWYLGVAKPSIVDDNGDREKKVVKSSCGHFFVPPEVDDVRVFKISGHKFIKLHIGTWHAGPLFKENAMDFYNLELSDTNVVDHTTHNFQKEKGVFFVIDD